MRKSELKNLWIGDKLVLHKSGKIGTFEGFGKNDKVRVKVNETIILSTIRNVSKYQEPIENWKLKIDKRFLSKDNSIQKTSLNNNSNHSIDLHLNILAPHLENSNTKKALDYQLEACREFILDSIASRRKSVTIIHGKGEGILKTHVHALLQSFKEVKLFGLVHQGGATEVLF